MKIEDIQDPIRMMATFAGGGVEPLRFEWRRRTHKIDRINARWIDRQGESYSLHYSVQSGDETYLLHFSSTDVQWWLDQVAVEG